ncbi:MAG TPA: hypothetical protein PLY70_00630 [Saprospiraceae bacterium]|nr:hypothetical protein [Saprospiraceae bacterium]HPN69795.1 hypothetical protein [Saprospiraceae bacterium]
MIEETSKSLFFRQFHWMRYFTPIELPEINEGETINDWLMRNEQLLSDELCTLRTGYSEGPELAYTGSRRGFWVAVFIQFANNPDRFFELTNSLFFDFNSIDGNNLDLYNILFDSALDTEYFQKPFIIWARKIKKWSLTKTKDAFKVPENQVRNTEPKAGSKKKIKASTDKR